VNENCCLVLFTKLSVAGRVKTRLIGTLSAAAAADLHAAFLADITERMTCRSFHFQIAWGVEDGEEIPDSPIPGFPQVEGSLGQRLLQGLRHVAAGHSLVAAVGSDHPSVSAERVSEAFAALRDQADIVIGPATDGGYYAIAAKTDVLAARLFSDIPWSSSEVLDVTLDRCAELKLRVHLLPKESDVDTSADLERLCEDLRGGSLTCPHTYDLLEGWGRLGADRQIR